jgi:hypothetical protein
MPNAKSSKPLDSREAKANLMVSFHIVSDAAYDMVVRPWSEDTRSSAQVDPTTQKQLP